MTRASIADTIAEFEDALAFFDDEIERLGYLQEMGSELAPLAPGEMTDATRVEGCQSRVWLVSALEDGRLRFRAMSDAIFVRGILAMLLRIFDDRAPAEVLAADPAFLQRLGISLSRRNGALAVVNRMRAAAASSAP